MRYLVTSFSAAVSKSGGRDSGLVIRSRDLGEFLLLGATEVEAKRRRRMKLGLIRSFGCYDTLQRLAPGLSAPEMEFFTEYADANRYKIQEKIHDIFEHISDAARILREIKLLRILRHLDIVEIKHIMLALSRGDFKDIYVVFELMESDLHQVIKANDDLTKEHYQFFLYQLLCALNYIHIANVYQRDLKPKNILANANCKLKICDFGLARVAFGDTPTTIFWTDNLEPISTSCVEPDSFDLLFTASDMGLAKHAAMFGQGLIGQGMPMKTALLAMLAAAGQNPATFIINPAMLAAAGHYSCKSIEC
ncbi:Mitogen-activated protein kinase 10 [Platanthera guangdongensis]|uniref:Mitogen-activated protein kinase 10 n=1 Tax=Platanthera guangdongensis TaxID=2320717 RepID=A0ABR2LJ88_9ASPA